MVAAPLSRIIERRLSAREIDAGAVDCAADRLRSNGHLGIKFKLSTLAMIYPPLRHLEDVDCLGKHDLAADTLSRMEDDRAGRACVNGSRRDAFDPIDDPIRLLEVTKATV